MLIGTLNQLTFMYGETVILDGVSADIPEGACIAVVGANGAGKTTLLSYLEIRILTTNFINDLSRVSPKRKSTLNPIF